MKTTFAILAGATALTALLGVPALTAARGFLSDEDAAQTAVINSTQDQTPFLLASNDDHEDDDDHGYGAGHDDDEHEDDDRSAQGRQPISQSATPPDNGLFSTGSAPKATVN